MVIFPVSCTSRLMSGKLVTIAQSTDCTRQRIDCPEFPGRLDIALSSISSKPRSKTLDKMSKLWADGSSRGYM